MPNCRCMYFVFQWPNDFLVMHICTGYAIDPTVDVRRTGENILGSKDALEENKGLNYKIYTFS